MTALITPATLQAWAQAQGLPRIDAQLLLLHTLGRAPHDRSWLLTHDTDALLPEVQALYESAVWRRLRGEPLAYITGHKEFFGLSLQVDARVLDPRPDTETLVDWALDVLPADSAGKVLDLGTGSGAVALAIRSARPHARVHAVDFSEDALAVAQANAQRLGLPVQFSQSFWMEGIDDPFALIVSNPPYVAEGDPHLAALVHEPLQALTAGADGLDDIRTIVAQAPRRLLPGGWLLLEHGWDQAATVRALLASAGFTDVASRCDLAGIERCSGGRWPA